MTEQISATSGFSNTNQYKTFLFGVSLSDLFAQKKDNLQVSQKHLDDQLMFDIRHFPFLDKKIVGVFRLEETVNIIVYSDGSLQKHRSLQQSKNQARLVLPFLHAKNCIMTSFDKRHPMLVLQSKTLVTAAYALEENIWKRKFSIDGQKYKLNKAFG